MIIYITCNPYSQNPFPYIEYDLGLGGGKEKISSHSSLGRVEDEPLEKNLSAYAGWDGLFAEAFKIWNLPVHKVIFCGSWEDYCNVRSAYEEYSSKNFSKGTTITDNRLAKNISPENRRQFLISRYEHWCSVSYECMFDELWRTCWSILTTQDIISAEKITKVKEEMNKYLQENYPTEKESWSRELENLLNARKLYEGNLILSTEQAIERLEEFKVLSKSLLNLKINLANALKAEAKKIVPPKFGEYMELIIRGKRGAWREQEDALRPMQIFRKQVLRYFDEIKSAWGKFLEEKIRHPLPLTLYSKPNLKIELTTCIVTSYRPAYFPGQIAGEVVSHYIDVATYEKNLLASVQKQILEAAEKFSEDLCQFATLLRDDLPNYSIAIYKVQILENRLSCLDEIKFLADKLTFFGILPEMECWLNGQ